MKERCGVVPLAGSSVKTVDYKEKEFCIELTTSSPAKSYHILANSPEDLGHWLKWLDYVNHPLPDQLPPVESQGPDIEPGANEIGVDDFTLLNVIGIGSFGKVLLVRKKDNQRVYAMKILHKKAIVERNEVEHTRSEKSILMKLECPFLVRLHYSFQTPHKLYFVMDYVNGGELFFHLQKEKQFSEDRVRFYGAEIVAGVEYLHSAGVIYRDLKPENLLLTNEGHLVMTDFGLSKEGLHDPDDRTATFCGTPEYLAPEILEGKEYGKAVDWWSFGTVLYELLTGLPPFYAEDVQKMYKMIMTSDIEIPEGLTPEAGDLLKRLLDRNPKTRLQDPDEIKQHPFFSPIDFELLMNKQLTPPFIPDVAGEDDTRNISEAFLKETALDEDDDSPISEFSTSAFEGFTYLGPV